MRNSGVAPSENRPPLVLTIRDRNQLLALLHGATTTDSEVARFLREEIARAEVAPDDVAPDSVVRMGSEVKFIEHPATRIRRAKLAFPEDAREPQCISILSSLGSALIGLGPGQSIQWTEQGRLRSLTVLEVRASAPPSSRSAHIAPHKPSALGRARRLRRLGAV